MLVKIAFGLSFMLNDYYAKQGPKAFFATWGSLNVALICVGCLFMSTTNRSVVGR